MWEGWVGKRKGKGGRYNCILIRKQKESECWLSVLCAGQFSFTMTTTGDKSVYTKNELLVACSLGV